MTSMNYLNYADAKSIFIHSLFFLYPTMYITNKFWLFWVLLLSM